MVFILNWFGGFLYVFGVGVELNGFVLGRRSLRSIRHPNTNTKLSVKCASLERLG